MTKWHKLGKVLRKKSGDGTYVQLGDPNGKKYAFSVDIRIRNASDEVVFQGTNVLVNVQNPRNNPNLTEAQKAKIPDFILSELFIREEDKE